MRTPHSLSRSSDRHTRTHECSALHACVERIHLGRVAVHALPLCSVCAAVQCASSENPPPRQPLRVGSFRARESASRLRSSTVIGSNLCITNAERRPRAGSLPLPVVSPRDTAETPRATRQRTPGTAATQHQESTYEDEDWCASAQGRTDVFLSLRMRTHILGSARASPSQAAPAFASASAPLHALRRAHTAATPDETTLAHQPLRVETRSVLLACIQS